MREESESAMQRCWRSTFVLYGVLSLSFMAGMGVGSGLFLLATALFLALGWRDRGAFWLASVWQTPYTWLSLGFFGLCLLSLVAAVLFPVEGSQFAPRFGALAKFHYFLLPPFVALAFLRAAPAPERSPFWLGWALMGAFLGLVGIAQFFGNELFPAAWLESKFFRQVGGTDRFHAQGLMFFHLSYASCMSFVACTAWARLLFPLADDSRRTRGAWATLAVLGSLGVFLSFSRISFVSLGLGVVLLVFLKRPRWGAVMPGVCATLFALIWTFSPALRTRFQLNAGGNFERMSMWRSAWRMFEERPLTGVGFSRTGELSPYFVERVYGSKFGFTSHAHNNFLDVLAATGLPGLLAFLLWWGFLFYAAGSAFRRAPEGQRWLPAALLAGFAAFQVNGLTQVNFWDGKSEHTLMIFAGLALALWLRSRRLA